MIKSYICLQSWHVDKSNVSITSTAVFSVRSSHYAVVVIENITQQTKVLCWPNTFSGSLIDSPVCVVLELSSSQAVHAVFPHPGSTGSEDFIILLDDCTVICLNSAKGSVSTSYRRKRASVIVQAAVDDSALYIMAKTTPRPADKGSGGDKIDSVDLLAIPFGTRSSDEMWSETVKPVTCSSLLCFAIREATLTCVWSDGSVTVSTVRSQEKAEADFVLKLPVASMQPDELPIIDGMPNSGVQNRVHTGCSRRKTVQAVAPHKHSAIIFCASPAAEGVEYFVISTLFGAPVSKGCVTANVPLLRSELSLHVAAPTFSAGDTRSSNVVLAVGGRIFQPVVELPSSNLAGVIGALAPVREGHPVSTACVEYFQQSLKPSCLHSFRPVHVSTRPRSGNNLSEAVHSSDGTFIQKQRTPWQPLRSEDDHQRCEAMWKAGLATGPINDDELQVLLQWLSESGEVITGGVLEKLANRFLGLRNWELLDQLVNLKTPLSLSLCHAALGICACNGKYRTLVCFLRRSEDIALPDFIEMLRALTSSDTQAHREEATALKSHAYKEAIRYCENAESKSRNMRCCHTAAAAVAGVEGFSGAQIALHAAISCRLDASDVKDACRALDDRMAENLFTYLMLWLERMLGQGAIGLFDDPFWCAFSFSVCE